MTLSRVHTIAKTQQSPLIQSNPIENQTNSQPYVTVILQNCF